MDAVTIGINGCIYFVTMVNGDVDGLQDHDEVEQLLSKTVKILLEKEDYDES